MQTKKKLKFIRTTYHKNTQPHPCSGTSGSSNSNLLGLVSPVHHGVAASSVPAGGTIMNSSNNNNVTTTPGQSQPASVDTFQSLQQQAQQQAQQKQQLSPQSGTQKFECDKCNLSFPRIELLKEHQLIHILSANPQMFMNEGGNPFALLQNLQQRQEQATESIDLTKPGTIMARKYSTDSMVSDTAQAGEGIEMVAKKLQKDQYDFLLNYFMQNESNEELKKHSSSMNIEFLFGYYQTNEIKKNNLIKNYDFLHQYYMQNREEDDDDVSQDEPEKLTLDFLLQFYQLNESKKLLVEQQQPLVQPPQSFSSALSTTSSSSHTGALLGASTIPSSTDQAPTTNIIATAAEKQANKRLRTTILPEQLNFLYECYQTESNPSRKMLEEISKKVNLKKRVVQVMHSHSLLL